MQIFKAVNLFCIFLQVTTRIKQEIIKGAGGGIEEIKLATASDGDASNCSQRQSEYKK